VLIATAGNVNLPVFTGADRIAVEQHPYFAFGGTSIDITSFINQPCESWAPMMITSWSTFGVTTAGEWSLGFNDCQSKFLDSRARIE
jgi:hypothetical protein